MTQLTERLIIGAAALVIGLLIGWGVRGVVTYNSNAESIATYQDWRVACPAASAKDQKCQAIEEVMDSKTGQMIVRLAITADQANKPQLQAVLPLGVLLEPGSGLILGTDPVRLMPYRTCTQVGCLASLALDDKTLASFKSSTDAKVLVAGMDGKPIAIPLSLKGYTDADHAYRSAEARRSSWLWRLFS